MAEGALLPPLVLRLAAPVLWTAFVAAPVPGWGRLDGVPLGPVETAALAAIWWIWATGAPWPGRHWLPVVLLALKVSAASLMVPHGFDATYFANAAWTPPYERSLAGAGDAATRRDARLQFGTGGAPELPLHFFHDNTRFNVATRAGRDGLPFSVVWEASWRVDEPRDVTLYVAGAGLFAEVLVDGRVLLSKAPVDEEGVALASVGAGWRRLTVRASAPQGRARAFEAGVVVDGARVPFGEAGVYPGAPATPARERDAMARTAGRVIDLAALAWIAGLAVLAAVRVVGRLRVEMGRRPRLSASTGVALASACALADALRTAAPAHGRVALLLGGDDMLTYATQARDILFNGVLMTGGLPVGQAEPFYYQPLYPYVLALTHVVFGEDTFGIVFLQRLGMWVAVLAAWRIAARLFGPRESLATLGVSVVLALAALAPWTTVLLGEAVFVPLVMLTAWALVTVSQEDRRGAGAAAGVVGGLATLSRSTLLPAWILVVPLVAIARRRRALPSTAVVALAVAVTLVVGTATLRNWVVSGRVVPIATSFPVNFELGNPPPPDLAPHDVAGHPWLAVLPVDSRTARVLDGAWHAPGAFLAGLGRKAVYVFGVFEPHMPGRGWSPWLVAASLLGMTGLLLAWRRGSGSPERWLPAALALSHFAAVTLIFPHAHGDRMILPFHALLLPYAGLAVAALVRPRYD